MYDISQLSLPWDKMDGEVPRQPRVGLKNIGFPWSLIASSIFDITATTLMWFVFAANSSGM